MAFRGCFENFCIISPLFHYLMRLPWISEMPFVYIAKKQYLCKQNQGTKKESVMPRIATIGFFDGVHLGHRYVFQSLLCKAKEQHLEPLIITFRQHPREVLQDGYVPELLTTLAERKTLLETYAETLVLDFGDIYRLTAEQFMTYLHDRYDVRAILMGYDHRFGSDGLSSFDDYAQAGEQAGIWVEQLPQYMPQVPSAGDGLPQHVSSTEIRMLLQTGKIVDANELLGYPYTLTGKVIHGNAIGRELGFPTANIRLSDAHKLVPEEGVYKAEAFVFNEWHKAVLNIGCNPTIGNPNRTLEVHIIGYHNDLYGQEIRVRLLSRLRGEQRFADRAALAAQIQRDIAACR